MITYNAIIWKHYHDIKNPMNVLSTLLFRTPQYWPLDELKQPNFLSLVVSLIIQIVETKKYIDHLNILIQILYYSTSAEKYFNELAVLSIIKP